MPDQVEHIAGCVECGWTAANPGSRCGGCGAPLTADAIRTATNKQVVQVLHNDDGTDLFVFPRRGRPSAVRMTNAEARALALLLTEHGCS